MKFLLDENISPKTADFLRELGHDVMHLRDINLKGATDEKVISYAIKHGLILITIDRGFGNILDYPPGSHPGIIRLKLRYMPSKIVNSILKKFLKELNTQDICGNLAIVEKNRYRLRKKI